MNTAQRLLDTQIAAKDIVVELERIMSMAEAAIIRKPAREIYEESTELFAVSHALVQVSQAAQLSKQQLLAAIAMPAETKFVHSGV